MSFAEICLNAVLDEAEPWIVRRAAAEALERILSRHSPDERTLTDMVRAVDSLGEHPPLAAAIAGAVLSASGASGGRGLARAFERARDRGHVETAGMIMVRMLSCDAAAPAVDERSVAGAVAVLSGRSETLAVAAQLLDQWIKRSLVVPLWAERVVERAPEIVEDLTHDSAPRVHLRVPTVEGWRVVVWIAWGDAEVRFSGADFGDREPRARAALDDAIVSLDAKAPGALRRILTRWRDGWSIEAAPRDERR